jgi:hypothetical protein
MIRRGTWIILVIFAILLAVAFFWQRSKEGEEAQITPTTSSEVVFDFGGAQVVSLRIDGGEGQVVELGRDEQGMWVLTWPKGAGTDAGKVEAAMTQLLALRAQTILREEIDPAVVGLSPAGYKMLVTLDNGQQVIANVGKETATGSGYYFLVNDRVLYVVDKYSLDAILNLVKEPPIAPTPTDTLAPLPDELLTPAGTATP